MQTLFHLTLKSGNIKTGPIPVSTSSRSTCPPSCAFYGKGCYAKGGPLGIHWSAVSGGKRGVEFSEFLAQIRELPVGQFWRHNQAGDLPGEGNAIDSVALAQLVEANQSKRGFSYSHKSCVGDGPVESNNREAIRQANEGGFTINLSANSPAHADQLASLGVGPVACVVPSDFPDRGSTPGGRKVVVCPAQKVEKMNCDKCRLCALKDRPFIVGFRPHGASKRAVDAIAKG